ncbi:MAG: alpha/beta fold hydrolase, partial [Patescibacteria group bacterium]
MKKVFILIIVFAFFLGVFFIFRNKENNFVSPLSGSIKKNLPLEKYSFLALREKEYQASEIILEKIISEEEEYTSWLFSYESDGKKVTGMLNIPKGEGSFPVVVMLRGYADDEIYFTGLGTRKVAGIFAENGFLTLAPDFLGFGGSDSSSADILEARFERPITVLSLLESIKTLEKADKDNIFLWGHSNGGQIAISVLEILEREIPTTLWAPVVKGFPESVLYYMDDSPPPGADGEDDQGKKVKKAIDRFIKDYNEEDYSIETYFSDIKAP